MAAWRSFVFDPRLRRAVAWLVLIVLIAHRGWQAWTNFENADRPDGNFGHTAIDFAGQWMMGRMLVLGHGRELYSRQRHLELARIAFPRDSEAPGARSHDAEILVACYPGPNDDPVGGPLYPPIHAFVMAPLGLIDSPQVAYRTQQALLFVALLFAAFGVRAISRGQWWWPVAACLLFLTPGMRAGLDLGQNPPISVVILIWGWALLVRGRPSACGIVWGLLAFKPVWAISFLAALMILREWRAVRAMIATGLALILITIPVVGIQAWFDWLHVGQLASAMYNVDRNWIFLSRDLFGVPRRALLNFDDGRATVDRPLVAIIGWALWLAVVATTFFIARCGRGVDRHRGPYPAMVLLAAWLCTYRFMYYDSAIAIIGVVVLLADPWRYLRRSWWPIGSWAVVWVTLMLVIENVTVPFNVMVTGSVMNIKQTVTAADGTTSLHHPTFRIGSGDEYPWDTLAVMLLWAWCCVDVYRSSRQLNHGATDVRTA